MDFGAGSEGAEGGVDGDFFDGVEGLCFWLVLGQIEAGDLETVEEQAGAAGIEVVGGDALENFGDGELNAGAVCEIGRAGEGEASAAAAAGLEFGGLDGAARGVVVVAELFAAETGAGAAAAVGEDVAALEALGGLGDGGDLGLVHGVLPLLG